MITIEDISYKSTLKSMIESAKSCGFSKLPKEVYKLWVMEFWEMERNTKWDSDFDYDIDIHLFMMNKRRLVSNQNTTP